MRSNPVQRRLPPGSVSSDAQRTVAQGYSVDPVGISATDGDFYTGRSSTLPMTVHDRKDSSGSRPRRRKKRGKYRNYPLFLKRLMKRYLWGKTDHRSPYKNTASDQYVQRLLSSALIATLALTGWIHHRLGQQETTRTLTAPGHQRLGILTSRRSMAARHSSLDDLMHIPLLYNHIGTGSKFHSPPPLSHAIEKKKNKKDYGGLEIRMLKDGATREIFHDPHDDEGEVYADIKHKEDVSDSEDQYYAFDDDYIRNTYYRYEDDELQEEKRCRRTNWHRMNLPTCNTIHEEAMHPANVPTYLSHGYYRDVFVVSHEFENAEEEYIFKQIRFGRDYDFAKNNYEYVRMDAFVSERLTANPRIVDVYGLCGLSILSEYLPAGDLESVVVPNTGYMKQEDLNDKADVDPQNAFTPTDKLLIASEMAEAIAALHGYKDGVIVHDDIQLGQFLFTNDGFIKLNDFNRAEIMLWDEENKEYCRYTNGAGNGNYRAPEEYQDKPLNEKIDVFSFGNNIYTLLTGLYMFYDTDDDNLWKSNIVEGKKPFVDERYRTRSFAEGKLVEIMERCWEYDPDDRADIFEVVQFLRHAVDENDRLQEIAHNQK